MSRPRLTEPTGLLYYIQKNTPNTTRFVADIPPAEITMMMVTASQDNLDAVCEETEKQEGFVQWVL